MSRSQHPLAREGFLAVGPHASSGVEKPHAALREAYRADLERRSSTPRQLKLAALGALGAFIGIGGTVFGMSMVQASDRVDMYETFRGDQQRRAPAVRAPAYTTFSAPIPYAPAQRQAPQPLGRLTPQGAIMLPDFNLNPFNPTNRQQARRAGQKRTDTAARMPEDGVVIDTNSGAANSPRTICVRLCDGFQHPLGYIRDASDMPGHEALCRAMFPDVPTRVFRVAAGAATIDDAVGPDGKTYNSLPMAWAYQTSIDPACARPRTGAQTVSLLKDFTLRPGDAVVTNGRVRVFSGGAYPYTASNFRDFRQSSLVSAQTRGEIDRRVGISQMERLRAEVRRQSRVREASNTGRTAVDVIRGEVAPAVDRTQVRVIERPTR
jgi:hypothetical protein